MGVDQARADFDASGQAHRSRRLRGQPGAERRPRLDDIGADPREAVSGERAEAETVKKIRGPAPFVREIGPFTGQGANRAAPRAGGAPGQEIRQVEKRAGALETLRHMLGEPQQFGDFHFRRDFAADIAQDVVAAAIDPISLAGRAMIHPDDDVPLRVAARADSERGAGRIEHDERTCRIKTDAGKRPPRQPGGGDRLAHGAGRRAPDVFRRMFDDFARLAPDRDRPLRARQKPPGAIEHARPRAARADVNADIRLVHMRPPLSIGATIPSWPSLWQGEKRKGSDEAVGYVEVVRNSPASCPGLSRASTPPGSRQHQKFDATARRGWGGGARPRTRGGAFPLDSPA